MGKVMLITAADRKKLLKNGTTCDQDHAPVVKIFNPYGKQTWLISEMDPANPDILFGLCDLGFGSPELGSVSLSELQSIQPLRGLYLERDRHFDAKYPMSAYARLASAEGKIVS